MSQKALITGGASGIGLSLSRRFLERGWTVYVHYHSTSETAEELGSGDRCDAFQGDLRDSQTCRELVRWVSRNDTDLDLLVNNAALFRETSLDEAQSTEDWNDQMNLNARAPYLLARGLRDSLARGGGSIVNLLDAALRRPYANRIPYFASKGALQTLTRNLARALAPEIRVNAVSPGPIDFPDHYDEERVKKVIDQTLLKRQGRASEIADAVEFLACTANYTTGVTLEVDGGQHIA